MNTKDTAKKLLKITSILFLAIIFAYLVQYAYAKFVISSNKNITLNFYEYRIQTSEIKIEPEGYTGGNVTVTITGSEANLQIEYQIGEQGEWNTYTAPFEIEENTTINVRYVTDGFVGPVTSKIIENMVVAKIGNKTYATLQEAVTASTNNTQTEIIMLADTDENVLIPATKNIVLNTNGKTITSDGKTIVNNGTLKIIGDGIVTGTGAYDTTDGSLTATIYNTGKFELDGGNVQSETSSGISNHELGQVIITSGTVSTYKGAVRNASTLSEESNPAVKINGGEITSSNGNAVANLSGAGIIVINNGKITDTQTEQMPTVLNRSGTIIINGGNISSDNDRAVCQYLEPGTIEVRGGTITGEKGLDISIGTMKITGGTVNTTDYGAHINGGILTIGDEKAATPSTEAPLIRGGTAGVKKDSGTLNYYGGKIIGPVSKSITGTVNKKPEGYIVYKTSELIENVKSEVAILSTNVLLKYDINYFANDLWSGTTNVSNYAHSTTSAKSRNTVGNINAKDGQQLEFIMNAGAGGVYYKAAKLTVGQTYTTSVYVKASRDINLVNLGQEQGGQSSFKLTTNWQRVTKTFTATDRTYTAFTFYTGTGDPWKEYDVLYVHSLEIMEGEPEFETKTVQYGSAIGTLITPTREGYVFDGWYTAPVGGTEITPDTVSPDANTTYYAHWVVDKAASTTIGTTKTYYDTVQEAINAAGTSAATIKILEDNITEKLTIASGQNITLNTNGKTITSDEKTIVNNGTLKIIGSGNITGTGAYDANNIGSTATISNYGSFELVGATIKSDNSTGVINCENGRTIITSGNIEGYKQAIRNKGILNTEENPAVVINGGVLISNGGNTVNNATDAGLIIINGGTISRPNEGTNPTVINYNGKIIINGGTITSETDRAVLQYTGGGTIEIHGTNKTTKIIGGQGAGADTGNMIITGGEIVGKTGAGVFANGGNLTIGKNDSSVSITTPDITGATYGLNVGNGSAYFYDGVIKGPGQGKSMGGTLTGIQSGYGLKRDIVEETDTVEASETLTLSNKNFQNTTSNTYYGTLTDAFEKSATGTTIKPLNSTYEIVNSSVSLGKTLILDLNGKRVSYRKAGIINKGNLTITGTSGIINSNQNTIKNGESEEDISAELTVKGGTVGGEASNYTSVVNYGSFTVEGGIVRSNNYRAIGNQPSGKLKITGGEVIGKHYTIYNTGTASNPNSPAGNSSVEITGGKIYSNGNVSLYNDSAGYIYLTGGTISQAAANSATYNKSTGTIHLAGATINHSATGGSGMANASTGKIIATSGTITSSKTIGIENLSTGTITIGTNETTPSVSTTVPSITGATKGVNNPSGKLYYYDGVIKATNGTAISGTVTGKPTGYNVKTTTSGTTQTSILALATSTSSTSSTFSLRPSVPQQEQTDGDSQTEQGEELEQTEAESQTEQGEQQEQNEQGEQLEQSEQTEQQEEIIDVQVEEEKNVQIGTNTYETINKAIESANNGDTIKILENIEITEKVEIPENKEIKIDLNKKTITSNLVNTIENKGTLTITSMGIIRNEVDNGTVILNNGTLNMENGIITNATNGGKGIYNEGTVNISGGKIVTEGIGTNCIYNAKKSKLNISGGIIEIIGFGSKGIYNNSEVEILKNEDEEIIPSIVVSADDCIGIYNSEDATVCNIMSAEITIEAEEIENYEEIKNTDEFKAELEEMKSSYGIYNNAEIDVNLEEVVIKVERLKGIGIYNNSAGSIVLGKLDDVVNVATPIIYAIADNTTAIVNVDTEKGKIKFYDGTFSTLVSIKSIITDILENHELFENIGENVINTILKKIANGDGANWQ